MCRRLLFLGIVPTVLITSAYGQFVAPFAGRGEPGLDPPAVPAVLSAFNSPDALTIDATGTVFIADTGNQRVRLVTDGLSTATLVGTGVAGYNDAVTIAVDAPVDTVLGLAADVTGNIYYIDGTNARIRVVSPIGHVTTVVGNGVMGTPATGTLAINSPLSRPDGLVTDPQGQPVFADDTAVYRLDASQSLSVLAGTLARGFAGDGGAATEALFDTIADLAYSPTGVLFIADTGNQRIRAVDATGTVKTVVGTGAFGYNGDALPATAVSLSSPTAVSVDSVGRLYFGEDATGRVRRVGFDGIVTTLAGGQTVGNPTDHVVGIETGFRQVSDIDASQDGHVFVVDREDHRVRLVDIHSLAPDIINEVSRSNANVPGSATVSVLETGAIIPGGTDVAIEAGRVRSDGLIGLEFVVGDRSNATEPIEISVDLRAFHPGPLTGALVIDSVTGLTFDATNGIAVFSATPALATSVIDVSMVFPVAPVSSSTYGVDTITGSVVIIDATDLASGESLMSSHPLNLAFTGDAAAGIASTTLEIDNTPPTVLAHETLVSSDGNPPFIPLVTPSVAQGSVILISATVLSDSISSTSQDIEAIFNQPQITRIEQVLDSHSTLVASSTGNSIFIYQTTATVSAQVLQSAANAPTLSFWDNLGNATSVVTQSFGVNSGGVKLFSSKLLVNGFEPPTGAFTTGPDKDPGSVAEIKMGDEIEVIASFFGYNADGLERMTLDVAPLYPAELSQLTNELLPSVTAVSGDITYATWAFATIDLGSATVPNVTFADISSTVTDTFIPTVGNAIPAAATPTALAGIMGSPAIAVQPGALSATSVQLWFDVEDTNNGFGLTRISDLPTMSLDNQPPIYAATVTVDPPLRPAPNVAPGTPLRVHAGDHLVYTVELYNPRIDNSEDDDFATAEGFEAIRADLSEFGGATAAALPPLATAAEVLVGAPDRYMATFSVIVDDSVGNTFEQSTVVREASYEVRDDVGLTPIAVLLPTPLAVDNYPPTVSAAGAVMTLVSGSGTTSAGIPISIGGNIPPASLLEPGSGVRVHGTVVSESVDNPQDLVALADHISLGLDTIPDLPSEFVHSDSVVGGISIFPVFQFEIPPRHGISAGAHHIVLFATDTVDNVGFELSNAYFLVDGRPRLRMEVLDDQGAVVDRDAVGKTLTVLAGRRLTVNAGAEDVGQVIALEASVSPIGGLAVTSLPTIGLNTTLATATLEIDPLFGDELGPFVVSATATDNSGDTSTASFQFTLNQPPEFTPMWTATISTDQQVLAIINDVTEHVEIQEGQRVDVTLAAQDFNVLDILQIAAEGPAFLAGHVDFASFENQSVTMASALPILSASRAGSVTTVLSFQSDREFTTFAQGVASSSAILRVSDGHFDTERALEILVIDDPVVPTISAATVAVDGATVSITDPIVVREQSTITVTVMGEETTGETVAVNGSASTGAGTFTQDGPITEWTYTPSLFDADVLSFFGDVRIDRPLDPTQLLFVTESPGSFSQPLVVNIDLENVPGPPILLVTATTGGRQIVSPQSILVFEEGDTLHVEAEAIDTDDDIMLITFTGLGGGQSEIIQTRPGHNITKYDTVLPSGLPFGATLSLEVMAADADQMQSTHPIELRVRKSFERLAFAPEFHATIRSVSGGVREENIVDRLEVLETDRVTLTVVGEDDQPGETFQLIADGPLLASPEIQFASLEGQSLTAGYQLPFDVAGINTIEADVEVIPGTRAAPDGGRVTYDVDLTLSANGDSTQRTVHVDVVDVDTRGWLSFSPSFQALLTRAAGGVEFKTVIDEFEIDENESILVAIQGNSIFPSEPLVISGTGSWLESPLILESKWGSQSTQAGDTVPFETHGNDPLQESVSLAPGLQAVAVDRVEKTYELELAISNLFTTATRTVLARVQNVNRADDLLMHATIVSATGGVRQEAVGERLEVMETDWVTVVIDSGDDRSGESFELTASGPIMASPDILFATFAEQSRLAGDSLPFRLAGTGAISATAEILAGSGAAPSGGVKTYEFELALEAGGETARRTVNVDVVDVDVRDWLSFVPSFQVVISDPSGFPRFESVTDRFDVREDEVALLAVVGQSIFSGEPLVLSGTGPWLSAPTIAESEWGHLSAQSGDPLPFVTMGPNPVLESVFLAPGFLAVPFGQTEKTYELELGVSGLHATVTRTVEARVLNVDRSTDLSLDMPVDATVTTETDALEILHVSQSLTIKDTERVVLLLSGRSVDPQAAVGLVLGGNAVSSPLVRHATFAGQSISQQSPLPFTMQGTGSITAEFEWEPGIDSATDGIANSYVLDITFTNGDSAVIQQLTLVAEDVDVEERIRIVTPLTGSIASRDRVTRTVSIMDSVTLREDERLELDVIGIDGAGIPVQMSVTGPLLRTATLKEVRLGDQILQPGAPLPLTQAGIAPVTVPLTIEPGYRVLPIGAEEGILSVSLILSDRYATREHAFDVTLLSVPAVPTIEVVTVMVNGILQPPTTAIEIDEFDSLRMNIIIDDPAGWPLDISHVGGHEILEIEPTGSEVPIELVLSLEPGIHDGDGVPRLLSIAAANPDDVTTVLNISMTVANSEQRPTLTSGIMVNGEPRPFVRDPAIGRGDVLKVTFEATDADPGDLLYLTANGSLFSPERIAQVSFEHFDPHTGDDPPYFIRGVEMLQTELVAYPGAAAVPEDASEARYTLSINVNDGLMGVSQSMVVTVTPSERPILSSGLLVNGEPRPFVLNPVIGRGDVLKVTFEATDADIRDQLFLTASGSLFNTETIERATFDRFDPHAGDEPPYHLQGSGPLVTELEAFPGAGAVPTGANEATYTLFVNVNDQLQGVNQNMIVTVTPSLIPPTIGISRIRVDGVPQAVGPAVNALEGANVEVVVEATDAQGLQLTLELDPVPLGAVAPIVVATGRARLTARVPIPATGSELSPIPLRFVARNSRRATAETSIDVVVSEHDNPVDFTVVMLQNRISAGEVSGEIDVPIGTNLSLIASATDPEGRQAIVVAAEGIPPSAQLEPPEGVARTTGSEAATVAIHFTPLAIGERHSILFTGADSEGDGPSGDRQIRVDLRIITDNLPPQLSVDPSGSQTLTAGDLLFVIAMGYDPDGDPILFEVFIDDVPLTAEHPQIVSYSGFGRRGATSASLILETTDQDIGTHELLLIADDLSWQIQESIQLTIEPNPVEIENWSLY